MAGKCTSAKGLPASPLISASGSQLFSDKPGAHFRQSMAVWQVRWDEASPSLCRQRRYVRPGSRGRPWKLNSHRVDKVTD